MIAKQILLVSTSGNLEITVWRLCILVLRCKGLNFCGILYWYMLHCYSLSLSLSLSLFFYPSISQGWKKLFWIICEISSFSMVMQNMAKKIGSKWYATTKQLQNSKLFFTSSPPGKFTEESSKTESSLEKVSTFHLFCPTLKQSKY